MASELIDLQVQNASVKKGTVDRVACTCTAVLSNGVEIEGVKLRATIDNSDEGIIVFPKDESWIRIALIENNENNVFVVQYSEIAAFQMKKSGFKMEVKDNGDLEFNDGTFDGLVKIGKLLEKLNRLEDKLKNHQHAYVPFPGGVAAPLVLTAPALAAIPPDSTLTFANTSIAELENKKIKH